MGVGGARGVDVAQEPGLLACHVSGGAGWQVAASKCPASQAPGSDLAAPTGKTGESQLHLSPEEGSAAWTGELLDLDAASLLGPGTGTSQAGGQRSWSGD